MEHFIVSARKYRPTTFEDVVGQKAITKTLENAIENNHLAQALLFTGPRGVGKTTCARILAKKINDDGTHHADEDFAFNIFELDAASNNSVDDIRNLIDQVRIPPQVGKYKVYIIDEVHMLSQAAFNAFLKTLEEPPKHAIFILATTEKHKIIPTILSRCQIFDFKRITVYDIKEQLHRVAVSEGVQAEDDALHIIAQKADGAMRDALSIFDRVVSFSGKSLTRQAVTENLNVLDYTYYFEMTDLLVSNNIPQALTFYDQILSKGFDGHHFISGLASHFRDLLVAKNKETIPLLEVGDQIKEMYVQQSQNASLQFLIDGIQIANETDLKYKTSRNQRLLVELCLMQLASLTFEGQKKNSKQHAHLIPPSHFKNTVVEQLDVKTLDTTPEVTSQEPSPLNHVVNEKDSVPNNDEIIHQTNEEDELEAEVYSSSVEPVSEQTNTEEILARQKKLAEKNAQRVSVFSLKSIEKKQELLKQQQVHQPVELILPEESFTEDAMLNAWNNYAKKVEEEGKFNLLSHLTMGVPKLEDHLIHLVFPNDTIRKEVEREKAGLMEHLRSTLRNYKIDLSIEVVESEVTRYVYTSREKFELFKEKNPLVETLRKEFDLDV